jgi:penicillin-insensitive murein endopeptidase
MRITPVGTAVCALAVLSSCRSAPGVPPHRSTGSGESTESAPAEAAEPVSVGDPGEDTAEGPYDAGAGAAPGETDASVRKASEPAGDAGPAVDSRTEEPAPMDEVAAALAFDGTASLSLGSCNDGKLQGAVPVPRAGPGFVHNTRRPETARYGTVETIQTLIRAAAVVERSHPGSTLFINDLSNREGGPIAQHGSHQSGRDVDILFYYLDVRRKPIPSVGVPLDPEGWGWDFKDLTDPRDDVRMRIDLRRTWSFLRALLEDDGSSVQRIFIAEHLRTLLLDHASSVRAPLRVRNRFAQVTCQPGTPHDDHMHVRFFCDAGDIEPGCRDTRPMYPWRRRELRKLGVEPVMAKYDRSRRQRTRARTVSPAEARRRAGPMHRRVKRFLDRRESWLSRPSPGRPWCK